MMIEEMSASKIYKRLSEKRTFFIDRAKDASTLTIPQLYPEEVTEQESKTYGSPYQSLGARGVNNLANKIILTLFPPATAFFKLGLNPLTLEKMNKGEGEIDSALQSLEKGIVEEMEHSQLRSTLVDMLKQLIVGGSSLIHVPVDEDPRTIPLARFVSKRSKSKKILTLCIQEQVVYQELDKATKEQLTDLTDKERDGSKDLDLYTLIHRNDDDKLDVIQEIKGVKIEGTKGTYTDKSLPYIFVPFVDRGQDYGRSYVEDFIGDLRSYEGLRQSILEASAEAARLIYVVNPNAVLDVNALKNAASGDVLLGNPDDVGVIQADKRLDVGMAQTEAEVLRVDLGTIFLLDSSVRRNAERVTAEEIRRVSQELEVALGGIYSTLANVLQEPLVQLYLARLVKKGMIDNSFLKAIKLEVTTGSAALGRGTEFSSLSAFTEFAQAALGEQFSTFMKIPELLNRAATSLDVNTSELIKTPEELQAEQQAQQQAEMAQAAVAPTINAQSQQAQQEQQQG